MSEKGIFTITTNLDITPNVKITDSTAMMPTVTEESMLEDYHSGIYDSTESHDLLVVVSGVNLEIGPIMIGSVTPSTAVIKITNQSNVTINQACVYAWTSGNIFMIYNSSLLIKKGIFIPGNQIDERYIDQNSNITLSS